jgi:hypothetical protein
MTVGMTSFSETKNLFLKSISNRRKKFDLFQFYVGRFLSDENSFMLHLHGRGLTHCHGKNASQRDIS